MMTIDDIKRLLGDRILTVVSDATGINRNTLSAIRDGKNTDPRSSVIERLSAYFSETSPK